MQLIPFRVCCTVLARFNRTIGKELWGVCNIGRWCSRTARPGTLSPSKWGFPGFSIQLELLSALLCISQQQLNPNKRISCQSLKSAYKFQLTTNTSQRTGCLCSLPAYKSRYMDQKDQHSEHNLNSQFKLTEMLD